MKNKKLACLLFAIVLPATDAVADFKTNFADAKKLNNKDELEFKIHRFADAGRALNDETNPRLKKSQARSLARETRKLERPVSNFPELVSTYISLCKTLHSDFFYQLPKNGQVQLENLHRGRIEFNRDFKEATKKEDRFTTKKARLLRILARYVPDPRAGGAEKLLTKRSAVEIAKYIPTLKKEVQDDPTKLNAFLAISQTSIDRLKHVSGVIGNKFYKRLVTLVDDAVFESEIRVQQALNKTTDALKINTLKFTTPKLSPKYFKKHQNPFTLKIRNLGKTIVGDKTEERWTARNARNLNALIGELYPKVSSGRAKNRLEQTALYFFDKEIKAISQKAKALVKTARDLDKLEKNKAAKEKYRDKFQGVNQKKYESAVDWIKNVYLNKNQELSTQKDALEKSINTLETKINRASRRYPDNIKSIIKAKVDKSKAPRKKVLGLF